MQDFFTIAIEITAGLGFAYTFAMFISGLAKRSANPVTEQIEVECGVFSVAADPVDAAIVDEYTQKMQRSVIAFNVVPFVRPQPKPPALEDLSIRELKKLAAEAKIRGYSNMRKPELIERLRAVRRAA